MAIVLYCIDIVAIGNKYDDDDDEVHPRLLSWTARKYNRNYITFSVVVIDGFLPRVA